VSARDKGTGREQKITIQAGTGLSQDEIERMKRDAEAHAEEDRKRQEEVQIRNTADSLAYTAEKTVREAGEKIPADVRSEIESAIKDVRDALANNAAAETLQGGVERLSAALQKAGSAVYGQGAEGGAMPEDGAAPEEGGAEEGTVEGEYREV
jgi:molecular chaperone DnaK